MAPGRNELCRCGSNRKYKHCHLAIDSAPEDEKYAASQSVYARNWKVTSESHSTAGVYRWLAERLMQGQPKRIFDIGSGTGQGLVSLRQILGNDIQIVAIDENRACLEAARDTLRRDGVEAPLITRLSVSRTHRGYEHDIEPLPPLPADAPCVLIEADLCNDPYLLPALRASGAFDAVTVWLTGTHMLRQENVIVKDADISSDGLHRLFVQNAAYELADAILRPGGVLQIGDRGMALDKEIVRADALRAHREQASVTSLQVGDLEYQPYEERHLGRTPMGVSPTASGFAVTGDRHVFSVISRKPSRQGSA